MAVLGSLNLLGLSSFAQPFDQMRSILLYNTKPAQDVFEKKQLEKRKRSGNKMAAPEASVHPVRNRLYHFFLYQTNESCSRIYSFKKRLMLLRSLNKSFLAGYSSKCYRGERPFYERSRMVLHVIRTSYLAGLEVNSWVSVHEAV